jgi:hypothetical protein
MDAGPHIPPPAIRTGGGRLRGEGVGVMVATPGTAPLAKVICDEILRLMKSD